MNVELAAHILAKGKRLAPDRFPQPGPETAEVWAAALSELDFPPALWSEAVVLWSTTMAGAEMVTPRGLIRAAYRIRDRWAADADKAGLVDAGRAEMANRCYAKAGPEPPRAAELPRPVRKPPRALTERSRRRRSTP